MSTMTTPTKTATKHAPITTRLSTEQAHEVAARCAELAAAMFRRGSEVRPLNLLEQIVAVMPVDDDDARDLLRRAGIRDEDVEAELARLMRGPTSATTKVRIEERLRKERDHWRMLAQARGRLVAEVCAGLGISLKTRVVIDAALELLRQLGIDPYAPTEDR